MIDLLFETLNICTSLFHSKVSLVRIRIQVLTYIFLLILSIPSRTMKLSTTLISLQCGFLSLNGIDAFMSSLPRTTFQPRTNPLYYIEIENGQPESTPKTMTDPVWIEETFMERAVGCTEVEEECDIEELDLLVDSLSQLDEEECHFAEPEDSDCEKEATSREIVKRVLQLKSELAQLEQDLVDNHFIESVKKDREEKHSGHWFQDYMDTYQF